MSDSEAIALPIGLSGQWSLFLPGDVPSTIELPSGAVTLHPNSLAGAPSPRAFATISGALATPRSGIDVQFLSRGRTLYAGATTQANGSFTFSVPVTGRESGLVLARNLSAFPDLGLASVSVDPGASATVDALALATPDASAAGYRVEGLSSGTASPAALPALPSGLDFTAGRLQVAMTDAQGPWRATVLVLSSPELPSYALPGFTLVDSYEAASNDGLRHAETSGPQGQVPDFLTPPDLSAVAPTFKAGTTLAWPAVAGASLYTLSLAPDNQATSPIWEGAATQPTLTLPADLTLPAQDVWLQVDAWDAAGVDIYSVASLRALRVPSGPQGPSGRHSWTRLAGTWQP